MKLIEIFQRFGTQETFAAGAVLYAEAKRVRPQPAVDARAFLLVSGQVTLTRNGKPLELVSPGESFGWAAIICGQSRVATSTARRDSAVLSLTRTQLLAAIRQVPETLVMIVDSLYQRLQSSFARIAKAGISVPEPYLNSGKLAEVTVSLLGRDLDNPVPGRAEAGGMLITQDGKGLYMYVLKQGRVAVSVNDQVVEYVGAGAVFGESALLPKASRAATAQATESCEWIALSRDDFLRVAATDPDTALDLIRSMCDRVVFASFLLSEPATAVRAINAPRLVPAAGGGFLGTKKMLYNRAAAAFSDEARARLASIEAGLRQQQRIEPQDLCIELATAARKVGAERFALQVDILLQEIESAGQASLVEQFRAVVNELQDTQAEITDHLRAS